MQVCCNLKKKSDLVIYEDEDKKIIALKVYNITNYMCFVVNITSFMKNVQSTFVVSTTA